MPTPRTERARTRPLAGWDPILGLYSAVLALAALQMLVLGAPRRTVLGALPYVCAGAVVAVAAATRPDLRDPASGHAWVRGVAAGAALLAAWAATTFLIALPSGIGEVSGFYVVKVQVTTPLGDHNTAAGLLLVGAVAATVASLRERRLLIAAAVIAAGLVATMSRGAAVVLGVVAGVALLRRASRRVGVLLATVAAVVLAGVLGLAAWLDAAPPPGTPLSEGPIGTSIAVRGDLAVRGAEVTRDHPLLGVGLGGFVDEAADIPPPNDHAHQLLTHAGAEGGVLLLVVALALPVVLFVRARRLPAGEVRDLVLLGGAALVLHAQADVMGGRIGYEMLLGLLVALAGATATAGRVRQPLNTR